jgi:hypothetical protein
LAELNFSGALRRGGREVSERSTLKTKKRRRRIPLLLCGEEALCGGTSIERFRRSRILADFVAEMCNALVAVSFIATPLATIHSHSVSVRIALVFNAFS